MAFDKTSKIIGKVEMLVPMCDWDDIDYVNTMLKFLNKTIFNAISEVRRYKSYKSNESYIGFTHTIRKN